MMALNTIRLVVGGKPWKRAQTFAYPVPDGRIYSIPTYPLTVSAPASGMRTEVFEVLRFGVHRTKRDPSPKIVGIAGYEVHTIKRWIPTYRVHSAQSRELGAWQVKGNYLIHDGPDSPTADLYATAGCIEICGGPQGFEAFNRYVALLAGSRKPHLGLMLDDIGRSGCMHITYEKAAPPPLVLWR